MFCSGISPKDKAEFEQSYAYLKDGTCLQKALLQAVAATGKTITICIDPGLIGKANASSSSNGTISFSSYTSMSALVMTDEFFHQVQFSEYGTPMAPNNVGMPNIEFESDLFRDLATKQSIAFGNAVEEDRLYYNKWLDEITHNRTYLPKSWSDLTRDANGIEKYYHIIDLYNKMSIGNLHHGTVDRNLKPDAIFTVLSKSNCN